MSPQFHDGAYTPVLDATFVMVARDPENKRSNIKQWFLNLVQLIS